VNGPVAIAPQQAGPAIDEVTEAARVLSATGLVDAFGHVSVRVRDLALMTPPRPLGGLTDGTALVELPLDGGELPAGVPREAWIHTAIYRARPDVGAICRAQPPAALAAGVAGVPVRALHGQGAFLGSIVPVFDDARLVRDRDRSEALAATLGPAPALIMRGNGAVAAATSPGRAVALMYVLERSAELNLRVAAAGSPGQQLNQAERLAWERASDELLQRLWLHLRDVGTGARGR
jgi:HCOMODA/2-hydroxy-3-carboxy-muconic semialdehyde decarboxylase